MHAPEGRVLVVRVRALADDAVRAEVRTPLGLVDVAVRLGARLNARSGTADLQTVMDAVRSGRVGPVLALEDVSEGERVEVLIEEGGL
jgi:hypothetical protein